MGMNDHEQAQMSPNNKSFEQFQEDLLSNNQKYYLIGELTKEKAADFNKFITVSEMMCDETQFIIPVELIIDSDGGDLMAAFSILNTMMMTSLPIYTTVIGTAASGAFLIAIAGKKRTCGLYSEYVFHKGGIDVVGLNADEFYQQSVYYQKQLDLIKDHVLAFTNITDKQYESHCKNGDWLFTAREALQYGLVDNLYYNVPAGGE